MTAQDLAKLLQQPEKAAPARDKSLLAPLFSIADTAPQDRFVSRKIVEMARIGNWGPQRNLAKTLAQHVDLT